MSYGFTVRFCWNYYADEQCLCGIPQTPPEPILGACPPCPSPETCECQDAAEYAGSLSVGCQPDYEQWRAKR